MNVASLSPESCPALVLNADYRPLSYVPLSLLRWEDALKAVFMERVNVVCEYDRVVRSPNLSIKLPSVISLKKFVSPKRTPPLRREYIYLRDEYTCQYCGYKAKEKDELSFDHVIPKARGGLTTWGNIVTACHPCNLAKGCLSPKEAGMRLAQRPRRPTIHELDAKRRNLPPPDIHETWTDYLYWNTELEP